MWNHKGVEPQGCGTTRVWNHRHAATLMAHDERMVWNHKDVEAHAKLRPRHTRMCTEHGAYS